MYTTCSNTFLGATLVSLFSRKPGYLTETWISYLSQGINLLRGYGSCLIWQSKVTKKHTTETNRWDLTYYVSMWGLKSYHQFQLLATVRGSFITFTQSTHHHRVFWMVKQYFISPFELCYIIFKYLHLCMRSRGESQEEQTKTTHIRFYLQAWPVFHEHKKTKICNYWITLT